ncbi:hypothetical protein ROK90_05550 [Cronobacter dublinensis]|uniref:hypothetical protein n=1 Tax=Cronobacter dublinensis TaxID=413497 RepID=UPI0028954BCE|nr:hypothetical protein [Cronobacter dublinensis]MDT3665481.1 hypothetical protein [Cronobacter dublinensis]
MKTEGTQNNDELIAAGHELAKCLDSNTPLLDIAKMIVRLADKLDVTTAALREKTKQCDALANELNAVEAIHNDAVFITDDHYDQCPPQVQKIIRKLAVMVLPSTDAFLREVRAQGVDMAACALDGVNQFNYANMLDELAQKLRQGGAA